LGAVQNPKTRWCCATLARLLVSLRLTIKFCFTKLVGLVILGYAVFSALVVV